MRFPPFCGALHPVTPSARDKLLPERASLRCGALVLLLGSAGVVESQWEFHYPLSREEVDSAVLLQGHFLIILVILTS